MTGGPLPPLLLPSRLCLPLCPEPGRGGKLPKRNEAKKKDTRGCRNGEEGRGCGTEWQQTPDVPSEKWGDAWVKHFDYDLLPKLLVWDPLSLDHGAISLRG